MVWSGDAGAGLELGCGSGRERGADDAVAAVFVGGAQGVGGGGLAGAGLADDEVDGVARGGDSFDHRPLLVGQVGSLREGRPDGRRFGEADAAALALDGELGGAGLELEDLGGGVDAREAFDGLGPVQVGVGAFEDPVVGGAVVGRSGDGADDVASGVGGVVLGHREREVVVAHGQGGRAHDRRDSGVVEAEPSGAVAPLPAQHVVGEVGGLVGSGGESGDAGASAGGDATLGHLGFDVAAALAELATDGQGNAGDFADTVAVDLAVEQSFGAASSLRSTAWKTASAV